MAKPLPTDLPYHTFATIAEFDDFLENNYATLPAFYLKLAKKSSGIQSITADEAIEVGLCHGWIDGWGRSIDDDWYFKRYTPRRPKSIWSQKNVATVGRLTDAKRMRPAGMAAVEAAKEDGRWDRAYGGPSNIQVPDDLAALLSKDKAALSFFEGLNRSDRYSVLWRVQTASPAARPKKVATTVELLSKAEIPGRSKATEQKKRGKSPKAEPVLPKKQRKIEESDATPQRRSTRRKA